MSYYTKYNFVSPEPIYAIIKEELKGYFDIGAADDLLFPTYLNKCLEKLGKTTHAIVPVVLFIDDFTCRLPDNFYAVREAWFCAQHDQRPYTSPTAFYTQADACTVTEISPKIIEGQCDNPICEEPECGGCLPTTVQAVYKTTREIPRRSFTRKFLLKPGNISFANECAYSYNSLEGRYYNNAGPETLASGDFDSFDLRDNKFVTTFRSGIVELVMYASDYDCLGSQLVPDNYRIKEYVEAFLKYKIFESLANQTMDETFNQVQHKMQQYKQFADEAYIMADIEIKKQDAFTKQRRIKKLKDRFKMYELPIGRGGYGRGRRRNN